MTEYIDIALGDLVYIPSADLDYQILVCFSATAPKKNLNSLHDILRNLLIFSRQDVSFQFKMAEMSNCVMGPQAPAKSKATSSRPKAWPWCCRHVLRKKAAVVLTMKFREDVMAAILPFSHGYSHSCTFTLIVSKQQTR